MDKHSNQQLIKRLEDKGISFSNGEKKKFNSYSYYQVINAYKALFVAEVETIDDIYINVLNNLRTDQYMKMFSLNSDEDLFKNICKRICKKYGLPFSLSYSEQTLIKNISKIKYVQHIYPLGTLYGDFLRMYKFEHELRNLLLKYTLIIEENIKNIFVKRLNNTPDVNANFLSDINNYDTSKGNNDALDTLKIILEKQKNHHSKPISRKREQDITIPYWILINELTMNETYNVIKNLKPELSMEIFQDCTNYFTHNSFDYYNSQRNHKQRKTEKRYIYSFKNLIQYIGMFRNMLAHNQPIYSYNHKDLSLIDFPVMNYKYPHISKSEDKGRPYIEQQHKINSVTMYDLEFLFGRDEYNRYNSDRNINLSFIIYIIYKIISTIDKNSLFYDELISLYKKYNIILKYDELKVESIDSVTNLISILNNWKEIELDYKRLTHNIDGKKPYKAELRSFVSKYNNVKKSTLNAVKKVNIINSISKYPEFTANKMYTMYTGIDSKYFEDIKRI